jgi:hypothetical protein
MAQGRLFWGVPVAVTVPGGIGATDYRGQTLAHGTVQTRGLPTPLPLQEGGQAQDGDRGGQILGLGIDPSLRAAGEARTAPRRRASPH